MPDLTIDRLRKTFGDTVALDDISLHAADGELLTLLGPSGCGKSTTLWSIAGLHQPDSGSITVGDTVFVDGNRISLAAEDRNCGVVFQSYAIWPHMTVSDNVGYPLKLRRHGTAERKRRVAEVLELVEMGPYGARYPHELSGGQQQRVALARALAHPPQLLLLDEPFSNLDAKLRDRAREWFKLLQRNIGVTTVFVTHDQDEALSMSDRIVVMEGGGIRQIGTPEEVYCEPADLFVADFVGSVNLLRGTADGTTVTIPGLHQPLVVEGSSRTGPVALAIRPEAIRVHEPGHVPAPGTNVMTASVVDRAFLGDHYRYGIKVGEHRLTVWTLAATAESSVTIELPPERIRLFDADQTTTEEYADVLAI
jgi:iron(III) transport system ATP-binding protein